MRPRTYQILDGDAWRAMTWAEIRAAVPAHVSDSTLRNRLRKMNTIAKLSRTAEEARADMRAGDFNSRQGVER